MTSHNIHIHSKKNGDMDDSSKFKIRNLNSIERRKKIGKMLKWALVAVAVAMALAAIALTILD